MARPVERSTEGNTQQPAWSNSEGAVAGLKANVNQAQAVAELPQAPLVSPTQEETEHSGAEAEEEDEIMAEEIGEGEGETMDATDPFARLPENATEEEQYEALTQQSLNADGTPKRPMNAFMIWGRRRRPQLADQHPMLRTGDISKLMSDEWSSMSKEEKEHYQNMAKRLKDAFNARWPTYVYKRRPNNSRRKRKKLQDTPGEARSGESSTRGIQKRGSFSSVGTISNITTFSSRPSTARSHSGQSAGTDSPPGTAGSRISSTSRIPLAPSQTASAPSVVQSAYGGYARPEGNGPTSWSWSTNSSIQHDLPVPSSTSAPSVPTVRRQHSQHSISGMTSSGQQTFKHEPDEDDVVYRSGNSPDTDSMWHASTGVANSFNITDFQPPRQRGDFNITDFQPPRDASMNDPNWMSHFQIPSSYPLSGSHNATSQSRSYSGGNSMPPLPGFPSGSRGSFSSLNAIHNFGTSSSSPQDRFATGSSASNQSPNIETAGRGSYSFSNVNGSFAAGSNNPANTPPADQSRSTYFHGATFPPSVGGQVPQGRPSLPNVLSMPQQGRPEDRGPGGYWSPHGEQPR